MLGFEPRISGVVSNRSANCATTSAIAVFQFLVLVEREVVHKLARTLSKVVDRRQLPSWRDLADAVSRKTTLAKFLSVAEELSSVVAKMTTSGLKRDATDADDEDDVDVDDGDAGRKQSTMKMDSTEPTLIVTQNICKLIKVLLLKTLLNYDCSYVVTPKLFDVFKERQYFFSRTLRYQVQA